MIYVVDLFSGAGGFSGGVHMAGHTVLACIEHWSPGMAIHAANFPDCKNIKMALGGDVASFVASIKAFVAKNVPEGAVWHFHASPPCQSFSIAQRQNKEHDVEKDARSNLTLWVFEVIQRLSPPRWSVEQVPGVVKFLKSHVPWVFEDPSVHIYDRCFGYEFGAPTMRKRLYMGKGWSFDKFTTRFGSKKRRRFETESSLGLRQTSPEVCDRMLAEITSPRYDGRPYEDADFAVKTSANKWVTSRKEREAGMGKNKWVPAGVGQGLRCISGKPLFATIASYPLDLYKRVSNNAEDVHPTATHLDGRWEKHRKLKPSELAAIQSFPDNFKIDPKDLPAEQTFSYYASVADAAAGVQARTETVRLSMSSRVRGIGNAVVSRIAAAIFTN